MLEFIYKIINKIKSNFYLCTIKKSVPMPELSDIKIGITKFEQLERDLHLKQLQINSLLSITQAINNNLAAVGLFNMYRNFLQLELSIKKMLLYVQSEDGWQCATSLGIPETDLNTDVNELLKQYKRPTSNLHQISNHALVKHFDVVIPVLHKDTPIAYAFLGGFDENEDRYSKIQFITAITNVIAVAIENKRLFKQQVEQATIKKEMRLAKEMQLSLVPLKAPQSDFFEITSIYEPHLSVGGDYYDFIEFDEKIMFCVADISGKGLAAAILMANLQANLRSLIRKRDNPVEFIQTFNKAIYRITQGEKYVTFFIAEYTPATRKLRYINCGHVRPILVNSSGITLLDKGGLFLGYFEDLPCEIEIGEVDVPADSLIVSYTDGITDTQNMQGEYWSDDMLSEFCLQNHHLDVKAFKHKIIETLGIFRGEVDYTDDVTLVAFKTK
jgi:phosphoserine phosphatase RsbU/P